MLQEGLVIQTSDGRSRFFIDDDFCSSYKVDPVNERVSVSFIYSWLALLSDSPLNDEGSLKPSRLYKDFLSFIRDYGLKNTIIKFSGIAHEFASQHTLMGQSSTIGDWIDDFKNTPVFFEYNRYFNTGDVNLFHYIYNFLVFGKKLGFVDHGMESSAFRGWLDIENRLADQSIPEEDIVAIKAILSTALPTFKISAFKPKFGPGSVSERGVRGHIGKVESFQYDRMIDRFLFHGHIGYYGMGEELGLSASSCVPTHDWGGSDMQHSTRIARLMFAPKDAKSVRSICMEPNVLQYFQQGILSSFMSSISSSLFSKFINLEDQSRNRSLAQIGSFTASIDTIDLSSASDCLSYDLVKRVFPPSWQIPMRVTRSHSCYTPEGTHVLKKFAPMGSALCFPTQCILFCAVSVYAACVYAHEKSTTDLSLRDFMTPSRIRSVIASIGNSDGYDGKHGFTDLAVYGDDICLDSRLTHISMAILDRLGFLVNRQKSFTGSQLFRESCGGYYLNGFDVTPIYNRGNPLHNPAQRLASKTALCNQAWIHEYRKLYRWTLREIITDNTLPSYNGKVSVLFRDSTADVFGVIAKNPTNLHLERRENRDYQRTEYRVISLTSEFLVKDTRLSTEKYHYMRWMSTHFLDNSADISLSASRNDTGGARVVRRWIPDY